VSVVCRAAGGTVHVVELAVPEGATLEDVIRNSGILERCPEIDPAAVSVGVFNRLCAPGDRVRDGDRVEIYRPLLADPKEARRRRARPPRRPKPP
jgi:putative ubiquitin-RnfH superfamily antitoxin RatB of RatAB toxin-antitoxin module